jgi:hypothetical protein
MSKPMINSPVLVGSLAENERCKLCTTLKITPVVVPSFWADCCNWCKRVKHPLHHKKGSLRRVRFSIYFFSPYGEKDGTRSKNRFGVPLFFFFWHLWQKVNRFVQPCGVTHSKNLCNWCVPTLHSFPYDQTSARPQWWTFQKVVLGLSGGHSVPSSAHSEHPVQWEREPAFARETDCGTTRFIVVGGFTEAS